MQQITAYEGLSTTLQPPYLHSFIMPMSTQRLSRHAWQWRLLSLVMVQLPLKGHVKEALRFILRLNKSKQSIEMC